uniref:protein-tyrosine-phosphatase n=1 Tax=Gouania willdenowi TaxID=441366 RepID=A0A8C5HB69_GOUWI
MFLKWKKCAGKKMKFDGEVVGSIYGPDEGWASTYPECKERNQSPINIMDKDAVVSTEYQELTLEGFTTESSNKTSMKNTGKTVAIILKDEYFVRGAGLPGRFKAEKVEFHWGPSNGSEGSEHSINGKRYPVEMQIYMYNSDDFDSLGAALREKRSIAATAVFFQVGGKDNPAVDPIIHGLKGVVHHEKETFLEPFVLKDLLPSSLGSYYRYTGSLTTPPCSKVVEWIVFSRPVYVSYKQLEAFYSIFTTEQQDHVKSVEYLRSNFRPIQSLDNRRIYKSAVKDAWMPERRDGEHTPHGTEAYKVCSSAPINMKVQHFNSSALVVRWAYPEVTYHPPILHFLVSYSWTSLDDSYEETHVTDANNRLEAIISPVSADVLYLFRVQAVCTSDMRSDFSQSMLFRANTTRIFEGTRIVKSGMPTVSPASSADMAPISSGSSTWTSSGIPFSFVSMATGIGPSSSGSQATVASLLTSALLAGLGFSGGVISSFPSSVWPSKTLTQQPTNARVINALALKRASAKDKCTRQALESLFCLLSSFNKKRCFISDDPKTVGNVSRRGRPGSPQGPNCVEWLLPLVLLSVLTFVCLTVLLAALVYWRYTHTHTHTLIPKLKLHTLSNNNESDSVPVQDFIKHVSDLYSNDLQRISQQFEEVQGCTAEMDLTSLHSNHPENKHKNRYINIWLDPVVIVGGYDSPRAYIAAQGPLRSTFEDFWQMVWEQNIGTIVMMTNLVEKGRRKCDQYWPTENTEEYGHMSVTLTSCNLYACYTIRCLTLRNMNLRKGGRGNHRTRTPSLRTVVQYHYTQWPDMGVPEYTLPVLAFIRRSSSAQSRNTGPVLVHCSAGVGRTGTYIVLHSMLHQIRDRNTVNVLGFLKHIRTQRNYLVQTEEQYVFIHDALMEAILGQDMEVSADQLQNYFNSITTAGNSDHTQLDTQFNLITQCSCRNLDCSVAQKECNKEKNRDSSVVPSDQARVVLTPLSGVDDSDYINASYIMGFNHTHEFIITQHPLPHTTKDFWRMIWDQNARIIVMLPAEDEFVYWPSQEEAMNCDAFTVSLINEDQVFLSNKERISIHDFILEAPQDDYVLEVRHLQCPRWPDPEAPVRNCFELINVLKKEAGTRDGPTVVHDELGALSAATLCALTTLSNQLQREGVVNVYHVVKMIHLMRPGVFTHLDQYQYLYRALLSLTTTTDSGSSPSPTDVNDTLVSTFEGAEPAESMASLV